MTKIDRKNWNNNTTSIPALTANSGVVYSQGNLNDIAFDKHNNLTVTQTNNNIWFSAINGYESPPVTFNTGFVEWTCADYDYTATGHLVVAYQFAGVAYFAKYVQTLTSITLAGAANQNGGISVGHDISVDFNSGDYWLIGDSTNSGGLNDLMTIDDATGWIFTKGLTQVRGGDPCSWGSGRRPGGLAYNS